MAVAQRVGTVLVLTLAIGARGAVQAQAPITVGPGHPALDLGRIHEGVDTTVLRWTKDGVTSAGPVQIEEVRFADAAGMPAIRFVTKVMRGETAALVDTSFFDRRTLAPISHVSRSAGHILSLSYHGQSVSGQVTEEGKAARRIDVTADQALFDPSAVELVIRAIEWKAGLGVTIPVFDHQTLAPKSIAVRPVGSEPVALAGAQPQPTWVLAVDYGTHGATLWVPRDGTPVIAGSVPLPDRRMTMISPDATVPSLAESGTIITPGSTAVDGNRLYLGTTDRVTTVTRDSGDPAVFEVQDAVSRTTVKGEPTLTRVQTVKTPRGTRVDSAIVARGSLTPHYHSGHMGKHSMQLYFEGAAVTGQYTPEDSTARPIDQALAGAVYDSNVWDLVISALPLSEGYTARLPLYWYEQGGRVWAEIAVTGSETVPAGGASVDAWVVNADFNGRKQTLWIAKAPRRLVKSHTEGSGFSVESRVR